MSRGTTSQEHEDTVTSRNEHLESIRRIKGVPVECRSTSRKHVRTIPERSSQNISRNELSTDGVIHLVKVLERREVCWDPYKRRIRSCGTRDVFLPKTDKYFSFCICSVILSSELEYEWTVTLERSFRRDIR